MDSKTLWNIIGGIALVAVAIFVFVTGTDPTYRYLGGAILAVLGAASMYTGLQGTSKEAE